MNDTPLVRTQDLEIRAQQWARMRMATLEYNTAATEIGNLRAMLAKAKELQPYLWLKIPPDTATLKTIANTIKDGQERLQVATQALLTIQGELEALQTALTDTED